MPTAKKNGKPAAKRNGNESGLVNPERQGQEAESQKESSLKVTVEDAQTIGKIATLRNVSIKNLFRQDDVRNFFSLLLMDELEKEIERLRPRKA